MANLKSVRPGFVLLALGLLSLAPYLYAFSLQDLRAHTIEFEYAFFFAFALYLCAVVFVLRATGQAPLSRRAMALVFGFAVLFRLVLVFTPPTLSDDMFRYIWDGRVQAQGLSPYAYPPQADALAWLRDANIYPHINRPQVITVYPAGAQLVFATLWRLVPDSVRGFQVATALGDLLAGGLLLFLLRAMNRSAGLVLIYLWSPLVIFETAHAAHLDGLVLPLLVAAWLARVRGRDGWVGVLLGAATAIKLYPVLLLPALWRPHDEKASRAPAWKLPLAFGLTVALAYGPYLSQGTAVLGFLPGYLNERFNMGLAGLVAQALEHPPLPLFATLAELSDNNPSQVVNVLLASALGIVGLALVLRPARTGETAVRRSLWMIGAFTLFTQNLFPWYMLWLVPLLALFLQPGRFGLQVDAWTGWFLFSGLVALAYTFFITWHPVEWALWIEFGALYAFLILSALVRGRNWLEARKTPGSRPASLARTGNAGALPGSGD